MATTLYNRRTFAVDLLRAIGNANPDPRVVDFLLGWMRAESGSTGGARFNPLNTTQREPGSWNFNQLSGGLGVQNFPTYAEGIQANATVLENGLYNSLTAALRSNDVSALGFPSGNPSGGVLVGLGHWVGHGVNSSSSYVRNIFGNLGGSPGSGIGSGGGGGFHPLFSSSNTNTPSTNSTLTSNPQPAANGAPSNGSQAASSGNFDPCSVPGAFLLDPVCIANAIVPPNTTGAPGTDPISQGITDAISSALKAVGTSFVHATGAKSATDLEQRAGLIGGGIILFFIGILVLFFAGGGENEGGAASQPTGGEEEEGGGENEGGQQNSGGGEAKPKKESKAKQGLKKGAEVAVKAAAA